VDDETRQKCGSFVR
jgi:hypothetical protein